MKSYLILSAFVALFTVSCSEESQIEGLIATKPTVVALNAEVGKGQEKTVTMTVNGSACNLFVKNMFAVSGSTEYRNCLLALQNGAGTFSHKYVNSTSYIKKSDMGTQVTGAIFIPETPTGFLFSTTNPVSTGNYTYYESAVKFNETAYIPVKFTLNSSAPVFGYLVVTPAPDKLVISKVVYNVVGEVSAGKE
ncbi:hypothetical protein ACQKLP_04480 [Chitinophaga sp. NPDC101104]|uniref:hypothetical protein n=1 Tax=Chitinophaga sp. NPDC101104 TaxID=3390561 RepID=UPI003CFFADAE